MKLYFYCPIPKDKILEHQNPKCKHYWTQIGLSWRSTARLSQLYVNGPVQLTLSEGTLYSSGRSGTPFLPLMRTASRASLYSWTCTRKTGRKTFYREFPLGTNRGRVVAKTGPVAKKCIHLILLFYYYLIHKREKEEVAVTKCLL